MRKRAGTITTKPPIRKDRRASSTEADAHSSDTETDHCLSLSLDAFALPSVDFEHGQVTPHAERDVDPLAKLALPTRRPKGPSRTPSKRLTLPARPTLPARSVSETPTPPLSESDTDCGAPSLSPSPPTTRRGSTSTTTKKTKAQFKRDKGAPRYASTEDERLSTSTTAEDGDDEDDARAPRVNRRATERRSVLKKQHALPAPESDYLPSDVSQRADDEWEVSNDLDSGYEEETASSGDNDGVSEN